jgi:hypothetical protein
MACRDRFRIFRQVNMIARRMQYAIHIVVVVGKYWKYIKDELITRMIHCLEPQKL